MDGTHRRRPRSRNAPDPRHPPGDPGPAPGASPSSAPITPRKDGTNVRDYIHVDDLADAHIARDGEADRRQADLRNLGTGNGFSVKEIIATAEKVTGKKVPVKYGPRRAGDAIALYADPVVRERSRSAGKRSTRTRKRSSARRGIGLRSIRRGMRSDCGDVRLSLCVECTESEKRHAIQSLRRSLTAQSQLKRLLKCHELLFCADKEDLDIIIFVEHARGSRHPNMSGSRST